MNLAYAMGLPGGGGGGAAGGDFSFIIMIGLVVVIVVVVVLLKGKIIKKNPAVASTGGVVMSEKYKPQYWAAKVVGSLTSCVGSAVLVLGVVGCIISVGIASSLTNQPGFDPARQMFIAAAAAGAVFSLQFALIGLLLAGMGQHFRATADNANHSGEILALMKAGVATPLPVPATRVPQQVSTGKFCSGCGAAVEVGSAFCAQCGVKS